MREATAAHAEAHDPQPVSPRRRDVPEKVDGGVDVGDHGGVAQPGAARGTVVAAVGAVAVEIGAVPTYPALATRSVISSTNASTPPDAG
jgi:hypothetical protein